MTSRSTALKPWLLGILYLSSFFIAIFFQAATLKPYDDEGYLMISLAQFLKGHALYGEVYTQYGPAYYLGGWIFYKTFGLSVTNDSTRLLNVIGWTATSVIGSLIALRLSGSYLAATIAHLLVFRVMSAARNEPGHPQVFCIVLLTLAVLMATFHTENPRRPWPLLLFGFFGGLLAVTKLNLGAYFALAGLLALVNSVKIKENLLTSAARGLVIGGAILFTTLLMVSLLGVMEVALFWISLLVGLAGIIVFARQLKPVAVAPNQLLLAIVGFLAGIALPCLFLLMKGSSAQDILYGLILQHVGFENVFPVPTLTSLWQTALSIGVSGGLLFWLKQRAATRNPADEEIGERKTGGLSASIYGGTVATRILALVKTAVGLLILILTLRDHDNIYVSLPLLWLGLLIPGSLAEKPEIRLGRSILCFAAIIEMLWVFPVAGTHVGMAAVLPVTVVALFLTEGIADLQSARLALSPLLWRGLLIAITAGSHLVGWVWGLSICRERIPLDMPGAHYLVRIYPERRPEIAEIVTYLRGNAQTFLMLPGMNSFYFWTQKEPPTSLNAGTWMTLLTDAEQKRVIQSVAGREDVLVLANLPMVKFWVGEQDISRKPLMVYIRENFRVIKQVGEYYILAPRNNLEKSPAAP